MAVEELKQNLQLCNFLFHRNPLDQNWKHNLYLIEKDNDHQSMFHHPK